MGCHGNALIDVHCDNDCSSANEDDCNIINLIPSAVMHQILYDLQ